jgi:hypothetical protein
MRGAQCAPLFCAHWVAKLGLPNLGLPNSHSMVTECLHRLLPHLTLWDILPVDGLNLLEIEGKESDEKI